MATSLTTTLFGNLKCRYTNPLDLSTTIDQPTIDFGDTLIQGTGTDQANMVWGDQRSLSATSENLDLAGGLTDVFGTTITFTYIKGLLIKNSTATAGANLLVGGAAANAWYAPFNAATDIVKVGPNGSLLIWHPGAGWAVTAGTGDILKIDSGAATIIYKIMIIGLVV